MRRLHKSGVIKLRTCPLALHKSFWLCFLKIQLFGSKLVSGPKIAPSNFALLKGLSVLSDFFLPRYGHSINYAANEVFGFS